MISIEVTPYKESQVETTHCIIDKLDKEPDITLKEII